MNNKIKYNQEDRTFEGVFLVCGETNSRGDIIFLKDVVENSIEQYLLEEVDTHKAIGTSIAGISNGVIDLKYISHKVVDLWWKGDDLYGKAEILDTPEGDVLNTLLQYECPIQINLQGIGSTQRLNGLTYAMRDLKVIGFAWRV